MRANVIIVAIDELLHAVVKGLNAGGLLEASVAFASPLGMIEFLLHLFPLRAALLSFGPRMVSLFAHLLGRILEHLLGIGLSSIGCHKFGYLHDGVKQNVYLISTPIRITFPRHDCTPIAAPPITLTTTTTTMMMRQPTIDQWLVSIIMSLAQVNRWFLSIVWCNSG